MPKAILFINGLPPTKFPKKEKGDIVVCTDGAYNYLQNENMEIDYVIGDLDSVSSLKHSIDADHVIEVYDQNYTDFQKALKFIVDKGLKQVDVYGGAGKEQDHFLGNLTGALQFKEQLQIVFHEDKYRFWFLAKEEKIKMKVGKIISLYPYPIAENIISTGVEYPLNRETLDLSKRIGIRNKATEEDVNISFEKGEMLVFTYH